MRCQLFKNVFLKQECCKPSVAVFVGFGVINSCYNCFLNVSDEYYLSKIEDAVVLALASYKFFIRLSSWEKQFKFGSVVEKEGVHPVRVKIGGKKELRLQSWYANTSLKGWCKTC